MNAPAVLGITGSLLILVVLFELLRRRHLREKYAVIWALVAVGVLVLTIFPALLYAASDLVGVDVPANLLFFLGQHRADGAHAPPQLRDRPPGGQDAHPGRGGRAAADGDHVAATPRRADGWLSTPASVR